MLTEIAEGAILFGGIAAIGGILEAGFGIGFGGRSGSGSDSPAPAAIGWVAPSEVIYDLTENC